MGRSMLNVLSCVVLSGEGILFPERGGSTFAISMMCRWGMGKAGYQPFSIHGGSFFWDGHAEELGEHGYQDA